MANTKELRSKIGSIKNTQKITSAMEMVAASKMRKAQERMARARSSPLPTLCRWPEGEPGVHDEDASGVRGSLPGSNASS